MDLKRFEYFLLVAEQGSFSRAAGVLGIGQPALGRQVRKLEQECGVPLFYRHGRGVALTAEGQALATRTRPLVRQLAASVADLREREQAPTGLVTLGMTPTMVRLIGVPLLDDVRARYPGIRLNIVSGYSGYIHEWLVDGRVNIAILHDARRSHHIAVDYLASAGLCLVSHAAQTSGLPAEIGLQQLARLPLALPSRTHGLRRTLEAAASKRRVSLNVQYEIDTFVLMRELAVNGIAHTVLALPAVQQELAAGLLAARPIVRPRLQTRLVLATVQNQPLTQAGRAVLARIGPVLAGQVRAAPMPLRMEVAAAQEQPATAGVRISER